MSLPNHLLQILVGGRDDPDVDIDGLGAPHAGDLPLLEHPQQLHLHVQRKIADLIQKDRAAVRRLEEALVSPVVRPGECALLIPEQLGLDQILRNGPAVDLEIWHILSGTIVDQKLGHQLLARSGLPKDQDRGAVKGRYTLGEFNDLSERLAICNNGPNAQTDLHIFQLLVLPAYNFFFIPEAGLHIVQRCDIPHIVEYVAHFPIFTEDRRGRGQDRQLRIIVVANLRGLPLLLNGLKAHRVGKDLFLQQLLRALSHQVLFGHPQ